MNMQPRKRVLIITPAVIVARGLCDILEHHREFMVTDCPTDLTFCTEDYWKRHKPDIVVMDVQLVDYAKRMTPRKMLPVKTQCALVSLSEKPLPQLQAAQYAGCITFGDTVPEIMQQMQAALINHRQALEQKTIRHELSDRERDVLVAVAKGQSNKEIADICNISVNTVVTHRKNIARKLGIKTIAGLTVYAILNNLLEIKDLNK